MPITFNDAGVVRVLEAYFNDAWPVSGVDLTLRLFCNNITPARGDVLGNYTEANGGGYAAKALSQGSWTVNPANGPRDAVYAEQTFTFTGELTTNKDIYGYFVTDADSNVVWAEKFGTLFHPYNNGDQLLVTPRVQMSTGTPTAP